jgi:purine-nucleoside phosphorylase
MVESIPIATKEIEKAINFTRQVTNFRPQIALILGSGLGNLCKKINAISTIPFSEIPNFPISSVQGHAGKLIFGYLQKDTLCSMPLIVFQGRIHFYETESIEKVVFPVIFSHQLGIKKLIITNAAGGINSIFKAGDLMLIQDVINMSFIRLNPAPGDHSLPRREHNMDFFDVGMKQTALQCALRIGIPLRQGSYCWLMGPSYETPAEIKMLKRIGADAVGMSTVPEIFIAHRLGIKTVGISFISNLAAGISAGKLSHSDVTKSGTQITGLFSEFIEQLVLSLK